jgi:hypothetical protein
MQIKRMCSAHGDRRGPAKGPGHKDGGRSRDPWHIVMEDSKVTLCGRNAGDYLLIDRASMDEALDHKDCCVRCASSASKRLVQP